MLAGLVLISTVIGFVATGSAIAMSMPIGMALLLYPVVCSLSLLMLAVISSLRTSQDAQSSTMARQQA